MSGSLNVVMQKDTGCVLAALTRASGAKPASDAERSAQLASLVGVSLAVYVPVSTDFKPPAIAGHVATAQLALEVVDSSIEDGEVIFAPVTFHVERSEPQAPAKLVANDPLNKRQCKIKDATSTSVTVDLVSGPSPARDMHAWLHIEDASGSVVYEKSLTWTKGEPERKFGGMNLTPGDYRYIAMLEEHLPAFEKRTV